MSLRAAINAKCKDCIYDKRAPGNWRQQVGACTISRCSLWPHRPQSRPDKRNRGLARDIEIHVELVPQSEVGFT